MVNKQVTTSTRDRLELLGSLSLLLHAQSKEWDLSSCLELKREANNTKGGKSWRIPLKMAAFHSGSSFWIIETLNLMQPSVY